MTELETLKKKKKDGKATPEDLTRLKLLQDGEPLSATDLEEAKKREEDRQVADKAAFEARKKGKVTKNKSGPLASPEYRYQESAGVDTPTLDIPPDHPRIVKMKEALLPFTKIEAHDSRPNEFVLFTRGISITAGDVRAARKAMKL